MKGQKMKPVRKNIIGPAAALALAIATLLPITTNAAEHVKGGEKLMELSGSKNKQEVQALKPGDTVAVACAHCKAIWMSRVPKKGAEGLVTFQGDDKVVCPKCGSTEAFCCVGKAAK